MFRWILKICRNFILSLYIHPGYRHLTSIIKHTATQKQITYNGA